MGSAGLPRRVLISGWGRTAPSAADVTHPLNAAELARSLDDPPRRGVLARGLGRSYGDTAQNAGGRVIDTTEVSGIIELDEQHSAVRTLAGTSLHDLMRWLVPRGFFVPVTPGTRYVTVGGAIANDVHGKDHHTRGSWCNHVSALTIRTPADGTVRITPDSDPDLFWATAGGLGLTGVILDATISLHPIETSWLLVDSVRTRDLDDTMQLMAASDADYEYSVAWIDLVARGASMGRSIVDHGRFATRAELTPRQGSDPLRFESHPLVRAPRFAPPRLLNRWSVRAFNELWYRKAPRRREGHLVGISGFFHPLDLVEGWNRLYGPPGFVQWQAVVPFGAEETLRAVAERFSSTGCSSFLAVLKRFGPGNRGHLSFPQAGWTLALDIPAASAEVGPLLDALDEQVAGCGGRVYLAKDSRLRPELLAAMYPRLDEWRAVRKRVDPAGVLQSDMGRRLGLC